MAESPSPSTLDWHELAHALFEEAGDALFLFDPESEGIHEVNPMAQRLTGQTRRALRERSISFLFRSEAQGGMQRLRQAFRRTGLFHSQEGFWLRSEENGGWLPVNLTVTRLHVESGTLGLITARDVREQKAAVAQVKRMEAELRRLMNSVSDCLWSAELGDGGGWEYCYFSPVVERLTGRPAPYFLADIGRWLGVVHPDDRPLVEDFTAKLRAGESGSADYRICRPDGSICWVRDSVMVTRGPDGPDGRPLLLDGILTDITDRKRSDDALRESAARSRLLLEQMPAILWTTDTNLRFTSGTGSGISSLQPVPADRAWSTLGDLFGTLDPDHVAIGAHHRALRGESVTYDVAFRGRVYHSHVEPLTDACDRVVGTIGVALDISDSFEAREALRLSESRYRMLVDNLTQCVFFKDRELRYVAVNKPCCESLGLTEAEIIGKTDAELITPDLAERYREQDLKVVTEGVRLELEDQNPFAGQLRTVQKVKTPVRNDRGEIVGVLGIFWDVTRQRSLELQLRQDHKLRAIGQLASGIAHDFNNLLTAVLGNLEMALSDVPAENRRCFDLLNNSLKAGFRAADLTRQLLSFARQTPLQAAPLDLNQSVGETVQLLSHTIDPRIEVRVDTDPGLWRVQADPTQVGQVLMNLCLNARDAMPSGGHLTLATDNVMFDPNTLPKSHHARAGEFVRLRVADTGVGMSEDVRAHLFEPFFTTKEVGKGTGLGLATVFGIIRSHDGWIVCQSAEGRGTCFDIYLPRLPDPARASAPAADAAVRGGRERILVADDQHIIRSLVTEILEQFGYRVMLAIDGQEAVDLYRRNAADIDLVILDVSMPRLSGLDALAVLRQISPGVRVLLSSGYIDDEAVQEAERAGAVGFIAKPYRPPELARRVRAALDRPGASPLGDPPRIRL